MAEQINNNNQNTNYKYPMQPIIIPIGVKPFVKCIDFDRLTKVAQACNSKIVSNKFGGDLITAHDVCIHCFCMHDIYLFRWDYGKKLELSPNQESIKFPINSTADIFFERMGIEYIENKFYNREELLRTSAKKIREIIKSIVDKPDCNFIRSELLSIFEILNC